MFGLTLQARPSVRLSDGAKFLGALLLFGTVWAMVGDSLGLEAGLSSHLPNMTAITAALAEGVLYPIVHLEHGAFWVALGLVAATRPQGLVLLITLVLVAIAGTSLPFLGLGLPLAPGVLTVSVLGLGGLLVGPVRLSEAGLTSLGAVGAVFQGAAQTGLLQEQAVLPTGAVLFGLFLTQFLMGVITYQVGLLCLWHHAERASRCFQCLGLLTIGLGLATTPLW